MKHELISDYKSCKSCAARIWCNLSIDSSRATLHFSLWSQDDRPIRSAAKNSRTSDESVEFAAGPFITSGLDGRWREHSKSFIQTKFICKWGRRAPSQIQLVWWNLIRLIKTGHVVRLMDQLNFHQQPVYLFISVRPRASRDLIWGPPGESVAMATPFLHPHGSGNRSNNPIVQYLHATRRFFSFFSSLERVIQMSSTLPHALNGFGRFSSLRPRSFTVWRWCFN